MPRLLALMALALMSCRTTVTDSELVLVSTDDEPTLLFITNNDEPDSCFENGQVLKQQFNDCGFRVIQKSPGAIVGLLGLKYFDTHPLPPHTPIIFAGSHGCVREDRHVLEGYATGSLIEQMRAVFPHNPMLLSTCYSGQCSRVSTSPPAVTCRADELSWGSNQFLQWTKDILCDSIDRCELFREINQTNGNSVGDDHIDGDEIEAWIAQQPESELGRFATLFRKFSFLEHWRESQFESIDTDRVYLTKIYEDFNDTTNRCAGQDIEWRARIGIPVSTQLTESGEQRRTIFKTLFTEELSGEAAMDFNQWYRDPLTPAELDQMLIKKFSYHELSVIKSGELYTETSRFLPERIDIKPLRRGFVIDSLELRCFDPQERIRIGTSNRTQTGCFPKSFQISCQSSMGD